MEEILLNAKEFLESAEDNLKKERWNAAVSDYFKSMSSYCDYLLYKEIKILPKNHNERFELLKKYFNEIYTEVIGFFKKYRDSYNLRLTKEDALLIKEYAYELKDIVTNRN